MKLSTFGSKFAGKFGIVELMDDLSSAISENPEAILMGGGNPARLPAMEAVFQRGIQSLLDDADKRHELLGAYQSPQGNLEFRQQLVQFLNRQYRWGLTPENIAISNGSQSAFFVLLNMFGGAMPDASHRSIHLPLVPEYMGYDHIGLTPEFFTATQPSIEILDDHLFKYHVDFSHLEAVKDIGALCVSRPTNPTGNVLTDEEMDHLERIALKRDIPLIVDGAYGMPFPNIVFAEARPTWSDNTILMLSLSKLGLPGARTGIVIAREDIIRSFTNANTVVSLACGALGPALVGPLFEQDEIQALSDTVIRPYYLERSQQTVSYFEEALGDLPFYIHKPEGAIFLWLWFKDLPISSDTLYRRIKKRGALVVPGQGFFLGIDSDWPHRHECIRVSYAQDAAAVKRGVAIIAEEVAQAYGHY
ncbi:MAG: valine--pyruvate transaminase [Pseudomonadota bacterium]